MGAVGGSGGGWQCPWVEKKCVSLLDDLEQEEKRKKSKGRIKKMVKIILNVKCIVKWGIKLVM